MEPQDRKRFALCLLAMAEIYGKQVSEAVSAVWWNALKTWDIQAVEEAFAKHTQSPDNGQFMPKPADIIRMLAGTSTDASMVAWAKVDKAIRTVGTYASVVFDDPLIHRVVHDMGGWIGLGQKDNEEWPFIANEFRTRYQGYRSRGETPDYLPTLIGLTDAHNIKQGFRPTTPVMIGDPAKAQNVLDSGTDKPAIGVTRQSAAVLKLVEHLTAT